MKTLTLLLFLYTFVGITVSFAQCASNTTLTDEEGRIEDEDYGINAKCEWLIQPTGAQYIILDFGRFKTDENDIVRIYKGTSSDGTLVTTLSGNLGYNLEDMFIESSSVFISLDADAIDNDKSFRIDYLGVNGALPQLLAPTISSNKFCDGETQIVKINYTGAFPNNYPINNYFNVKLSNSFGVFDDDAISLVRDNDDEITFELPEDIVQGI
ncbi:CUB domain-containing protein [Flammeovirga aprica]|uniref:CUB domain-containing protein n=1 Tax=Flammeovirga aprica JL-4 TaxID=694437 RepID=A0A7X9S0C9_9BACT|nr:CUB domain-containing protein [Flammeovirga aprica]NME72122.1 CUB domain-containing protein [Flammeovirga aprica JL-4]